MITSITIQINSNRLWVIPTWVCLVTIMVYSLYQGSQQQDSRRFQSTPSRGRSVMPVNCLLAFVSCSVQSWHGSQYPEHYIIWQGWGWQPGLPAWSSASEDVWILYSPLVPRTSPCCLCCLEEKDEGGF